jgi:hypothetical protein
MGMGAGLLLGAGLGLCVLREVAVVLRAGVRHGSAPQASPEAQAPAEVDAGASASGPAGSTGLIPQVVWTYWQKGSPPPLVKACIANWRREAPECEIRLLNAETFKAHLPGVTLPKLFDELPAYRQADWIRIQLLRLHGGIWLDATVFLTRSLAWVQAAQERFGAEFVGFSIGKFTLDPSLPVIENWFMAAPAGSAFLGDWAQEFEAALARGDEPAYLEALTAQGELQQGLQGIPPAQACHLIMHVAASVVLARHPSGYRLALERAEDGPFAFHAGVGWRKRHLYARLALTPCPSRMPALVKLRGVDRRVFERFLAKGWYWRRSALARYLGADELRQLRQQP